MQYSMLRFFLSQREVGPIIEAAQDYEDLSRQDYLKQCFSKQIRFSNNRGAQFVYAYVGTVDSIILGRVGRLKAEYETKGPETAFTEELSESWYAANILIDTSGENDGQKIAFEQVHNVGAGLSILKQLVNQLNENFRAKWFIDVNNITKSAEFWSVVKENEGRMTALSMTFVAPNIFKSADETSKVLKELKNENSAQKTTIKISNQDSKLNPDSDRIRDNIEYLRKGGGSYRLKSGKEDLYNSDEMPATKSVDEPDAAFDINAQNKSLWGKLINILFGDD